MDLQQLITDSQRGFDSIADPTVLFSLSKFEQYVNEAYEGRLFFELIQNARDAAFSAKMNSDISIVITSEKVLFANTGKAFDEKGVIAMTRLGLSPKEDNELIGSKGIGFKAIQEYSKTPKIITEFGTFYFNKEKVKEVLQGRFCQTFTDASVPLFYYPHYDSATCSDVEQMEGQDFTTIIDFALDKGKSYKVLVELFQKISDEELILLGSINSISFSSPIFKKNRKFVYNDSGLIECHDGRGIKKYKTFVPEHTVLIPDSVYNELDDAEKKTYENDRRIEIKLVFECKDANMIVTKLNSKLFLFYPLEMSSGFPYIVHSNFSCNPERTLIRNTKLNSFIFDEITTLQTGAILDYLLAQDHKIRLLDFVHFEWADDRLDALYELYVAKLRNKKFIWTDDIGRYAAPDELVYCTKEAYVLLKGHSIDGRHLFTCGERGRKFLGDHFQIKVLTNGDLQRNIEEIASREVFNAAFFQKLYAFLVQNNLYVENKKILLGSNNMLYSKEDDVFYSSGRSQIKIPEQISSQLVLLHPDIRIKYEDVSKSTRLIGIREYRSADLIDKALSLFTVDDVDNYAILDFLIHLEAPAQNSMDSIYKKIWVPLQEKQKWIMPVYHPVYFETDPIKNLYPEGNFIDLEGCMENIDGTDLEILSTFFRAYGVWDIPAMYFSDQVVDTRNDRERTLKIDKKTGKNAFGYYVFNDRILDFPLKTDHFFYNSICSNWRVYEEKILSKGVFDFTARSTVGSKTENFVHFMHLTSFIKTLFEESWVFLDQGQDKAFKVKDIIGLNRLESIKDKILLGKLDILVADYEKNKSFFDALEIDHFNKFSIVQIVSILNKTAIKFAQKENEVLDSDFKRFYHTILKYLHDTYVLPSTKRDLLTRMLGDTAFLCKKTEGSSELIAWKYPDEIYYIDERVKFENLPGEAKDLLGYYFTKNDKNEIGRIFSKIGHNISDEIDETLQIPILYDEYLLPDLVQNLPYIIAAGEDKLEGYFGDSVFRQIKELKLRVCEQDLTREITLNSIADFKVIHELKYYYDTKAGCAYISKKHFPITDYKSLLGEILNNVFTFLLERELGLGRLIKDLLYSKNSKTFRQALEDFEFDKERISEIDLLLNGSLKTPEQEFWSAVLFAKDIIVNAEDLKISPENFEALFEYLTSQGAMVSRWYKQINYLDLSAVANLELFREIIVQEGIMFDDLNLRLSKEINFDYLWRNEFTVFKNKNLPCVKWLLLEYFKMQSIEMKMKFYNAVIETEKLEMENGTFNRWDFNAAEHLVAVLNSRYSGFDINIESISRSENHALWKSVSESINENKRRLKGILESSGLSIAGLEQFIAKEENYSLLFFNELDILKNSYALLYQKNDEQQRSEAEVKSVEFPMAEQDNLEIEDCIIEESKELSGDVLDQVNRKINGTRSLSGSGVGRLMLPNQKYLNHIGQQGEKLLFGKLSVTYQGNVTWVSENATSGGFVPDKQAVGYDMRYIDKENQTHYVEVKTSTHEEPEFHISINEIRSARKYGRYYHVIWITNVFDPEKRKYLDLKNMFIDFNSGEDFFHNSKFHPELTGFKITFRPQKVLYLKETT